MKIVSTNDLFGENTFEYLYNEFVNNSNFLFISAGYTFYKERLKDNRLTSFLKGTNNFFTPSGFINEISQRVYNSEFFLPNIDLYYIFKKALDNYFKDKPEFLNIYQNLYYSLFDLYKFIMFHKDNKIEDYTINLIKENYSENYFHIFNLYNYFRSAIEETIEAIQKGIGVHKIKEVEILVKSQPKASFKTFSNQQKIEIEKYLARIDILYLDGFFIFDDIQNYIISSAKKMGKEIVFLIKDLSSELSKQLIEDNIYKFNFESDMEIEYIYIENPEPENSSLSYLKKNFYNVNNEPDSKLFSDGSIKIIEPFLNRSEEIYFIAETISNILRNVAPKDEYEAKAIIENEIGIVSGVRIKSFTRQFDEIFKQIGYFTYSTSKNEVLGKGVLEESFSKIYYNRNDFLNENVKFIDGTELSLAEKNIFFELAFRRICMSGTKDSLINSPVLDYIFQIYSIAGEGISVKKFKNLLFSNWYYHTQGSNTDWDRLVGVFRQIEVYFEGKTQIDEWINELKNICNKKNLIRNNDIYKFHPFNSVDIEDLQNIISILEEIREIVNLLSVTVGNIKEHLLILKTKVMSAGSIISLDESELSETQAIIKKFYETVEKITSNSSINNLDSNFFANHLKNIFANIEETEEEGSFENYCLKIENRLSLKKCKQVFFMGLEADKYPMKNKSNHFFTEEIIEILNMLKIKSMTLEKINYNLIFERYCFKNVIDSAKEEIYFTSTSCDGSKAANFSVYIEDIKTTFNIPLISPEKVKLNRVFRDIKSPPVIKTNLKDSYSIKELVTFKLCPKLYYHLYVQKSKLAYIDNYQLRLYAEAVMFIELLDRIKAHNIENNIIYSLQSLDIYIMIRDLAEITIEETKRFFNHLSLSDLEMIKKNIISKIVGFINGGIIKYMGYTNYTIEPAKPYGYECGEFTALIENDTVVINTSSDEKRYSQNKLYLDFLALKTTDKAVLVKHYNEMNALLNTNKRNIDRIYLANRMINKINIQFNSEKYANDGKERVEKLSREILDNDFSKMKPSPSNFCMYCILNSICKGDKENMRGVNNQ